MKRMFSLAAPCLALLLLVVGCGGDGGGGPSLLDAAGEDQTAADFIGSQDIDEGTLTVETEVSENDVDVGTTIVVTCIASADGTALKLPASVHVLYGETETVVEPGDLTLDEPGDYEIWCTLDGTDVVDESPELVTANITDITHIETVIDPDEVPAGQVSHVTCTASNDAGQTQDWKKGVRVTPEDGVSIDEQDVTGLKTGEYEVQCKGPITAEISTATLTVVPGNGHRYEATLDPASVAVTESSTVGCLIYDDQGNETTDAWVVSAPENLEVTGTSVKTTVAGTYQVGCKPLEAKGGEELVSATLTVSGGPAVGMSVYLKPEKDHYLVKDQFSVVHNLVDEYGNEVGEAPIEPIAVAPAEGIETVSGKIDRFNLLANGIYEMDVKALELPYTGHVTVICDSTGPKVTVTYPERAANITGNTLLTVTGYISDEISDVASATVNGEPLNLDANGNFSVPMQLGHGMNVVNIEALDTWGNVGRGVRSMFYSSGWQQVDMATPLSGLVPDSLLLWLSQEFIDDGDHSLPADDLATLLEQVAGGIDLTGLIPAEPLALSDACTLAIDGVSFGVPAVSLSSMDQALRAVVSIPDLAVDVTITCCYQVRYIGEYCDPYYGAVYADEIALDVFLFISADGTGDVDVELGPIEAEVVGIEVDIQGLVGPLFDPLVSLLVQKLTDTAIQQVQEQFGAQIPQMVDDAVAQLYNGMAIELPALLEGLSPTPLMLNVVVRELLTSYEGISVVLDAAVSAEHVVAHDSLGLLKRDGCMGANPQPFDMAHSEEVNLAAAIDLVNELLYSVWYGGALALDIPDASALGVDVSQYGISNLSARVDLLYAPFVESCGLEGGLKVQIGDAFMNAVFDMMGEHWDFDIYLFLQANAFVELVDEDGVTKIALAVGELEVASIEVARVGEELKGRESMVDDLFTGLVLPLVVDQLLGTLGSFDLPAIDLHSLSEMIPEGTVLSVDLQKLELHEGYIEIGGKLK